MTKEAEFAFKQAFAYCPYSPEAVFHFMDLLLQPKPRLTTPLPILETCHKLDPYNGQISDWIDQLTRSKSGAISGSDQLKQAFGQIQRAIADHQTNAAAQMLEQLLGMGGADPNVLMGVASAYLQLGDLARSEQVVQRLTQALPASSEPLYNLAVIQAARGKVAQAVASLQKSLALNAVEIAKDPKTINLRQHLFQDPTFTGLRQTPEFQKAFGAKP